MIGDSPGGGCGAMEVGGFSPFTIGHPTYGCSRLNIAENNTPIVSDRIYTSYRHFHNSTEVDIFSTAPFGGRNSVDIDTITIGIERMLTEQNSIELRVPINRQLTSDIGIKHCYWSNSQPTNQRSKCIFRKYGLNI